MQKQTGLFLVLLWIMLIQWTAPSQAKPLVQGKPFPLRLKRHVGWGSGGFFRRWNPVYKRTFTVKGTGYISSPNYPSMYPNNVEYRWVVTAPAGYRIRLQFLAFNVENNMFCDFDSLSIYDGVSRRAPLEGVYCGHCVPSVVTLCGNTALLVFSTDYSSRDSGFKIHVQFLKPNGSISTPSPKPSATTTSVASPSPSHTTRSPAPSGTTKRPVPSSTRRSTVPSSTTRSSVPSSTIRSPVPSSTRRSPVPSSTTSSPVPSSRPTTRSPVPSSTRRSPVPSSTTRSPVPSSTRRSPVPSSTTRTPAPSSTKRSTVASSTTRSPDPSRTTKIPIPSRRSTTTSTAGQTTTGSGSSNASVPIPLRCGRSMYTINQATPRIVGGKPSRQGEWPWIGILMNRNTDSVSCGGSLINQNWILTAAHCFEVNRQPVLKDPSLWKVRLGEHNMLVNDKKHVDINAKKIIMHPKRNASTQEYDFALVQLERPVQLNDYINVVCLPSQTDTFAEGQTCVTAGWGSTDTAGTKFPTTIRKLNMPLMSRNRCNQLLGAGVLKSEMFCAGYVSGGNDTCSGDSGGPLVCQKEGQYVLKGVVSWGFGCGVRGYPGIYANVQRVLSWIEANTVKK